MGNNQSDTAMVRRITELKEERDQLQKQVGEIARDRLAFLKRAESAETQLAAVRELKGFSVPYAPLGEKAVWKSDIEAAIKGEK